MKERVVVYTPPADSEPSNVVSIGAKSKGKEKKEKRIPITDPNKMNIPDDEAWKLALLYKDYQTVIAKSVHNAQIYLAMHPRSRDVFWFNTFTRNIEVRKCPLWCDPKKFKPRMLEDSDDTNAKAGIVTGKQIGRAHV